MLVICKEGEESELSLDRELRSDSHITGCYQRVYHIELGGLESERLTIGTIC